MLKYKGKVLLKTKLIKQQSGLISVTVTIVIMILVTLIVSSFALIVRREQSRTLNNQLNTQALSAAEAGIKDVQSAIYSGELTDDVDSCTGSGSFNVLRSGFKEKVSDNVNYSCVLVNQNNLPSYKKDDLTTKDGQMVIPINVEGTTPLDSLRISWQGSNDSDDYSAMPNDFILPQSLNAPMLRVVLFKASGSGLSRDSLKASAHTMFLSPNDASSQGSAGSVKYLDPDPINNYQGAFVDGKCHTGNAGFDNVSSKHADYACNVDITGLTPNIGIGDKYYLVVKSLYKDPKFSVTAYDDSGIIKNLPGLQIEIDATGKAADVLKRIRVRVPSKEFARLQKLFGNSGLIPDAVISSTKSICKKWTVGLVVGNECNSTPSVPGGGGGGGGGSGNGDSSFGQDTCDTNPDPDCDNGVYEGEAFDSEQDPRRSERYVTNISTNSPSNVAGCIWDWGDGSSTSNVACNKGEGTSHEYPRVPSGSWWQVCEPYTATLTIFFNNGYPNAQFSEYLVVPIKSSVSGHSNPC